MMPRLITLIFCCVNLFFVPALCAASFTEVPWIIDEVSVLSQQAHSSLTQVLAESAQRGQGDLKVIILEEANSEAFESIAHDRVVRSETRNPKAYARQTSYLVINMNTEQSVVILGKALMPSASLIESIRRIQTSVVSPALASGYAENAVREGAIALITVLQHASQTGLGLSNKPLVPETTASGMNFNKILLSLGALVGLFGLAFVFWQRFLSERRT